MAVKITHETILEINRLYKELGAYSRVAKIIGCAPTTVKKYVIPDFREPTITNKFTIDKFPFNTDKLQQSRDWGQLCDLTQDELNDITSLLWEELAF